MFGEINMGALLSVIMNLLLLVLHILLKSYRVLLGLIALGLIALGILLVAPFFVEMNVSYPFPVCGIYLTFPQYARINGSNKLILRAQNPGTTIEVREGNYLITLDAPINLDPDSPTKKVSIDFQVAPSSLWNIPAEKGSVLITTINSNGEKCLYALDVGINWWTIALHFLLAVITVIPGSWLLKIVLGR